MSVSEIEADLRTLGRQLDPAPDPTRIDRILALVGPEPAPPSHSHFTVAADYVRRTVSSFTRASRAVVAVIVTALVVLLVATPVGATVAGWFGFGGVQVVQVPIGPFGQPAVPTAVTGLTVDEAAALVSFSPVVPAELGPPDAVEVSADRRVLSMSWSGGPDGVVRLDQFDGALSPIFVKKYYQDIEFTTVDGAEALWFSEPHLLIYVGADGKEQTESARLAAQTLIWQHDGITFRLEGDLTEARAIQIAQS